MNNKNKFFEEENPDKHHLQSNNEKGESDEENPESLINQIKEEIIDLSEKIRLLKLKNDQLVSESMKAQAELAVAKTENEQFCTILDALIEKFQILSPSSFSIKDLIPLQEKIDKLQDKVNELANENQKQKDEIDKMYIEINAKQTELDQLRG